MKIINKKSYNLFLIIFSSLVYLLVTLLLFLLLGSVLLEVLLKNRNSYLNVTKVSTLENLQYVRCPKDDKDIINMFKEARDALPYIVELSLNKDGIPRYWNIFTATYMPFNIYSNEGNKLKRSMEYGIEAIACSFNTKLDLVPKSELERTRELFYPNIFDSADGIYDRLHAYQLFIFNVIDYTTTGINGKPSPENIEFRNKINKMLNNRHDSCLRSHRCSF